MNKKMKDNVQLFVNEKLGELSERVTLEWQNTLLILTGKIDNRYFTQADLENLNWYICNKWKSLSVRMKIERVA